MQHIKNYSKSIQHIYQLLLLSETPCGFFKLLVRLMNTIKSDKTFQNKIRKWMQSIESKEDEVEYKKKEVIEWMQEKLADMRRATKERTLQVKNEIDRLEKILSGEHWEIRSGGYVDILTHHFSSACRALAYYGPCKICDQWLKVRVQKYHFKFKASALKIFPPKGCENKMIDLSSKEGKQLEEHIQHGFIRASGSSRGDVF